MALMMRVFSNPYGERVRIMLMGVSTHLRPITVQGRTSCARINSEEGTGISLERARSHGTAPQVGRLLSSCHCVRPSSALSSASSRVADFGAKTRGAMEHPGSCLPIRRRMPHRSGLLQVLSCTRSEPLSPRRCVHSARRRCRLLLWGRRRGQRLGRSHRSDLGGPFLGAVSRQIQEGHGIVVRVPRAREAPHAG